MKSSFTNILLSTFILISGTVMSQDNAIQKQPFSVEYTDSGNLLTPTDFKAHIYPNPTFDGKVKMIWPDWADVSEIHMILTGPSQINTNLIKVIEIANEQKHVAVSNLHNGIYIIRFMRKNEVLGVQKLKVLG